MMGRPSAHVIPRLSCWERLPVHCGMALEVKRWPAEAVAILEPHSGTARIIRWRGSRGGTNDEMGREGLRGRRFFTTQASDEEAPGE